MSEGDPEAKSLAMKLAAQTVMQNPANNRNMVQPSTSTPVSPSNAGGFSPEMGESPFIPPSLAGMRPKAFDDDGLGELDEDTLRQIQGASQPPQRPQQPPQMPPPQNSTFQPQPTNHQAVFSPDLQGTILRKLATIEKSVLTTAESIKNIEKKLDLLEQRIEFSKDE